MKEPELCIKARDKYDTVRKFVRGQDEAVKALATFLWRHELAVAARRWGKSAKSGCFLLGGPSGCGKTEMIKRFKSTIDVPMSVFNAPEFSATGWKGEDLYTIISRYANEHIAALREKWRREESDEDEMEYCRARLEEGVIVLDEFDKLRIDPSTSYHAYEEAFQNNLLKLVEGTTVSCGTFSKGEGDEGSEFSVDTSGISFILAGAFSGLEKVEEAVEKERQGLAPFHAPVGFAAEEKTQKKEIGSDEALIRYGIKLELAGRISQRCMLRQLNEDDLFDILTGAKDTPLDDYIAMAGQMNATVTVSGGALRAVARKAAAMNEGARGLRSIFNETLGQAFWDLDYCGEIFMGKDLKPQVRCGTGARPPKPRRSAAAWAAADAAMTEFLESVKGRGHKGKNPPA